MALIPRWNVRRKSFAPVPLFARLRYIQPAIAGLPLGFDAVMFGGNGAVAPVPPAAEVGVLEVSGRAGAPRTAGETVLGTVTPTAFSYSSNRTSSRIASEEFAGGTSGAAVSQSVPVPNGEPRPSRHTWKLVLKPPVPPWIQRAAKVFGSG